MKHFFRILLLLVLIHTGVHAQDDPQRTEKIRALRVTYISNKLNLTPDQAAKFWPVYNRYTDELRSVRKGFRSAYQGPKGANMDRDKARKFVDDNIEYQQQEVALKAKYKDELLKVISPQQLATLYQAERDFKTQLIQQLQQK